MKPLCKILLPVDFSKRSPGAARYAKTLAGHFRAGVTVLHVLTPVQYEVCAMEVGGPVLTEPYSNWRERVQNELQDLLAGELKGIDCEQVVLEGDPAWEIVHYAHEKNVDLIVMPTHGYGPFRRFILGSVTAKVLHDADCPVWTGAHLEEIPREESISFRNVVCAIDLGPQSFKTLEWAIAMQKEFDARLAVVHATACPRDTGHGDERLLQEAESVAREELARLTRQFGVEVDLLVVAGDPPKAVCETAWRLNAGMLVMGRSAAKGVFGRLRTNAYAIIRDSPCSVVSV